jgi:hypothetical protein
MRIDMLRAIVSDPDEASELLGTWASGDPWCRLLTLYHLRIMRPVRNADVTACLEEVEDQMREAHGLPRLRPRPSMKMPGLLGELGVPGTLPLVRMTSMLEWERYQEKIDFAQQHLELLDVALALKRYRAERGEYPATLADLQATLSHPLPQDHYANAPLKYRHAGDGFVLYSIGPDGDDDGGLDRGDPGFEYWDNLDVTWKATERPPVPPAPRPTMPAGAGSEP